MGTHKDWSHLTPTYLDDLYRQLGTWRAVEEYLEIDHATLIGVRKRLGMQTGYPNRPPGTKPKPNRLDVYEEEIVRLARDGRNCYEIAETIGEPSAEHVREFLARRNISRGPAGAPRGHRNPFWSGGRVVDKHGYILVLQPNHPRANSGGYVREHRLVMEHYLGRYLEPGEVVHHVDGNRQNNQLSNLRLFQSNGEHLRHEWSAQEWAEHQSKIRRSGRAAADNQTE